jgi:hypothetical protein
MNERKRAENQGARIEIMWGGSFIHACFSGWISPC